MRSPQDEEIVVSGQVTVQEAGLTDDINLDTGVFALISAPRSLDLTETRNPLLERVRLNVDVDTASPIVVDNNLARAEITRRPARPGQPVRDRSVRTSDARGGQRTAPERAPL